MIEPKTQETILAEYDKEIGTYRDLSATIASLLERMLVGTQVQLHSITQRYKKRESLAGKLAKPDKEYGELSDVTDLAAVRIIIYFAEDVNRVAEIIEREFLIDRANSIDKRMLLAPDRFGYQSLHYVATLTTERCCLVEYARFGERKFEIQVRSILQHAWAEIEHDLGYKSAAGIPREIRRRFSRIAGLLELADDEFSTIRQQLTSYAAAVSKDIQEQPENVGIDKISLRTLVSSDESASRRLSWAVASAAGAQLKPITDEVLESNVNNLNLLNISTISDLEQIAASHIKIVENFASHWLAGSSYSELHEGIGLFYLAYVLLAEQGDVARIRTFIEQAHIDQSEGIDKLVNYILETYRKAIG